MGKKESQKSKKSDERKSIHHEYKRKCHDCGALTNDYRCQKCWQKLKEKKCIDTDAYDLAEFYQYNSNTNEDCDN